MTKDIPKKSIHEYFEMSHVDRVKLHNDYKRIHDDLVSIVEQMKKLEDVMIVTIIVQLIKIFI